MAIGPNALSYQTKESLELADSLERIIDEKLRTLVEWDGRDPVHLLIPHAKPNTDVQAELRRRYTGGEDGWSEVGFESASTANGFWITLEPC